MSDIERYMKILRRMMVFIISVSCLLTIIACSEDSTVEYATVIIKVMTADDTPVNNAIVLLENNNGSQSMIYIQTTNDGTVVFYEVVQGVYKIFINSSDYKDTHLNFLINSSIVTHSFTVYKIGDIGPAGGLIFYDKGAFTDGWRYLEAAPTDEFNQTFVPFYYVSGTSHTVGSGNKNTQLLVAFLNSQGMFGYDPQLCADKTLNGFSDWFLPSRDELSFMYSNLHVSGKGGFQNSWYGYSSLVNNEEAWCMDFVSGFLHTSTNNIPDPPRVRAIRAF